MEDINHKANPVTPILLGVGIITVIFAACTIVGLFRVHIENLKTRTVWIFNAPSEGGVSLTPEDITCLRNKSCELLEDGTIKVK
jgi:hypothetical protein